MCKVLEIIAYYRLLWFLEKINYLTPYQNGLRKNNSTYDNLSTIKEVFGQVFKNKQILSLACLNITKKNKVV